ncbi:hypothetical protein HJC23_005155 [Cyclotella cryptica]|uniref:BACK domain-containing protein n=1 Tax=Cyclotella cryptica TaxID=29204 RepID=A0ABD3QHJ9_9STRA
METTSDLLLSFPSQIASFLYDALTDELEDYLALEAAVNPGTWQEIYLNNLEALLEKERVPFDLAFQVDSEVVKAHRCILEARKFHPLISFIERNEFKEGDLIVINEPPYSNPHFFHKALKACYGIAPEIHEDISILVDVNDVIEDIGKFDPNKEGERENLKFHATFVPPDDEKSAYLQIIGSPGAKSGEKIVWAMWAHKAILGAHSQYFLSAMEWEKYEDKGFNVNVVHLDSDQFPLNLIKVLISCCYGGPPKSNDRNRIILAQTENVVELLLGLNLVEEEYDPIGTPLALVMGASYLIMPAVSLQHEVELSDRINSDNVVELLTFAQDNGAQLLQWNCYKYLCDNLSNNHMLICKISGGEILTAEEEVKHSEKCYCLHFHRESHNNTEHTIAQTENDITKKHPTLRLTFNQFRTVLQSKCIETQESELLEIVLFWSRLTKASKDTTKELINLLRLPFVPVNSKGMRKAVDAGLVTDDMIRLCRLFQEDTDHCATVLNSEKDRYCPRYSTKAYSDLYVRVSSGHSFSDSENSIQSDWWFNELLEEVFDQ